MNHSPVLLACVTLLAASACWADSLEMKDGKVLQGTFLGGTAASISFKIDQGTLAVATADIAVLRFQAAAVPIAPAALPAPVTGGTVVPAGTVLTVRTVDLLSSTSKGGTKFGIVVDKPVGAGSTIVIPAGTRGYGLVVQAKEAGRIAGKSELAVTLLELTLGGRTVPLQTDTLSGTGKGSAGKVAGGAALGLAVGAITGNAGKGAAIGATVGAAKKGQTIGIPPNTLLEFVLGAQVLVP